MIAFFKENPLGNLFVSKRTASEGCLFKLRYEVAQFSTAKI